MMRSEVPPGTADSDLVKMLCRSNLALTPNHFLSSGNDSKGKYQGCSSFNQVLIFSQQMESQFEAASSSGNRSGIQHRNAANAPTRRVMILLFRSGSVVDPANGRAHR